MTEKQFAEIQERYVTLPSVGVPSQVRLDLAACISEIARVDAPFEPSDEEREAEQIVASAKRELAEREAKHTSGARKK